jgi:hypothetical protein
MNPNTLLGAMLLGAITAAAQTPAPQPPPVLNPAPGAADWVAIGQLPDWSGVWLPDRKHPNYPFGQVPPPWNEKAAKYIAEQQRLDKAGTPNNLYINCLPEGMPSFVIMTLNASEFLFTPGRVTVLSEFDGNRQRRIWTDGRPRPEDADATFNGFSRGRWERGPEGQTLVVETTDILPQTFLPLGQAVGQPNNGDLRIVERIRLVAADRLEDALEIHAPQVLTAPWKITKSFVRTRERRHDIVEGACLQGKFHAEVDANGNHVFVPIPHEVGGAPLPSAPKVPK